MIRKVQYAFAICILFSTISHAYVQSVHRLLTSDAVERSPVDWRLRVGISKDDKVLGLKIADWASQGAFDEDAISPKQTDPPYKDVFFRSLHHFYDPVDRAPLTEPLAGGFCTNDFGLLLQPALSGMDIFISQRADRWALGNNPNAELRNKFDLDAAHEDYFQSVVNLRRTAREERLVHLFKSMGHIVHLIQDMGQPEHTRNDQHLPLLNEEASLYENYGELVFADKDSYKIRFQPVSYPIVDLPRYASYFSADGITSPIGVGLADYSNRNFITQDTEYGDTSGKCFTFDLPSQMRAERRFFLGTNEELRTDAGPTFITVDEWILSSPVDDAYTGTTDTDAFHAFYSTLDLETRPCPWYRYTRHLRARKESIRRP